MKKYIYLQPDIYKDLTAYSIVLKYDTDSEKLSVLDEVNDKEIFLDGNSSDMISLVSRLNILEEKVYSLTKTNTEVVSLSTSTTLSTLNNASKDFIVSGSLDKGTSIVAKSFEAKNLEINAPSGTTLQSGAILSINAKNDVEIKNSSISMNQSSSSNCIRVINSNTLIIKDTTFSGKTYNTIMTGQGCVSGFLKNTIIDNCNFNEDCSHINIWFSGHEDDAVLTISNCHFKTCEQFLCISDFSDPNNKLTVNIINCTIDDYDDSLQETYGHDYSGIILIESRKQTSYDSFIENNIYGNGKLVLNINNLIVKGKKITKDNFKVGTGTTDQMLYYFCTKASSTSKCIKYSDETKDLFPTINIQ